MPSSRLNVNEIYSKDNPSQHWLKSQSEFPTGIVLNEKVLHTRREGGAIATANADNSFVNTGIAGSFTTKASSSTSDMVFNLYSGMMHCQSSVKGETAICLTTSSNTTYSNTNNLLGGCQYQNYIGTSNEYQPTSIVLYNHFITYSAGDTLYWRLFMKKNTTDGNNFYVFHAGSTLYITMREILK